MERNGLQKDRMYVCWFYSVPGIGSRTLERLETLCPNAEEIYRAGEKLWRQVLTAGQLEQIRKFAQETGPEALQELLMEKGISFVTLRDEHYPGRLREIPDPPYGLFVKGQLPTEECPAVAVIGARDCSEYGSFVADGIGRRLAESGVQVVSGMARGIDGISQAAALKAGGRSFGVLGCGVDICYPAANRTLYDQLCEQGGVLSVHPPGTEPRPQHFPPRNRIVSGLADALVVVEARDRSGTLITVDMALEQGREVYAVPGRVTDRLSDGCNHLLRQGAGVFLSPEDFLRELEGNWRHRQGAGAEAGGVDRTEPRSAGDNQSCTERSACMGRYARNCPGSGGLPREQREVYDVLEFQPLSVEQIGERLMQRTGASEPPGIPGLTALLMGLCMAGLAVQVSPGQFARRGTEN